MLDQQLKEFARRAEAGVTLPDIAELARRGQARRRRRRGAVAALAACVLGAGYVATSNLEPGVEPPATSEPAESATPYPGSNSVPPLDPGTYELNLHRDRDSATALVTVPENWRGWHGPNRAVGRNGYVGVLILDVDQVTTRPCRPEDSGMEGVGNRPADLVRALMNIPRHRVVAGPEPDGRFGHPSTHLTLQASAGVECTALPSFPLWDSGAGIIPALGPHARMDLWVVDLHGEAVLVSATSDRGTPEWAVREMEEVVNSVEFVR